MTGLEQAIRFTEVAGRRVAWSSVGSGPPLVIGGWWMSHLELDWQNPGFRRFVGGFCEHRTVIRYDRPGTGMSEPDGELDASMDNEVNLLDGVLDAVADLLGDGPVELLGASYGGPVAAAYARRAPDRVRCLALYGAYADGSRIASPDVQKTLVSMVRTHWGLGSRVLADLFLPGGTAEERAAFVQYQRHAARASVAAKSLAAVYTADVRHDVTRIAVPSLVLHRRGDRTIPFALGRELGASIPGATFVPLAGEEHFPWRGDAASLAGAVLEFLGVEGQGGAARPAVPAGSSP